MDPFQHTESVALELSNSCSHAWLHKKCPLYLETAGPGLMKNPITLPSYIVERVIDSLARHDYNKLLAFHQYNEPLQDPRLFMFLQWAKERTKAKVYIVTNGYNLDGVLVDELVAMGVQTIIVSPVGSPGEAMLKRQDLLANTYPGVFSQSTAEHIMDDRLEIYDVPKPAIEYPCRAPLRNVVITRDGKVGLCCFDWKRLYTFGDLRAEPLEKILSSSVVTDLYGELSSGVRSLSLCRQCGRSR